jgi:hypothetical protein
VSGCHQILVISVAVRRWVHEAMVERWQVNPHHQDQAIVLTGKAQRQQPQFPGALHG